MIKKIKKIKNLGIFQNYAVNNDLPKFKKYNLFYGWNGSGKTTLSKLFDSFNSGKNTEYSDLEYELESEVGSVKSSISQNTEYQTKIRVFNKKYIEDNIKILEGKAKSIFILGAENKKLAEQIIEDEKKLKKLKIKKDETEKEKTFKENEKGKKFTDVAKIIGANLVGSSTRNYRKPDAEADFNSLKTKQILENEKVDEYQTILKQEQKSNLLLLEFIIDLDKKYHEVSEICKKTVESEVLLRLKENSDVSEWVETGIELHKLHKNIKCEFCNNIISESRLKDLSNHFNEADQKLKQEIDLIIEYLEKKLAEIKDLKASDKTLLYKELHTKYNSRLITFNLEKGNLSLEISTLVSKLKDKKTKTTEEVSFTKSLENNFSVRLNSLNEVLRDHNDKTENFQTQKDDANLKLKNHYLSEIFDDVEKLEKEIVNNEIEIKELQEGINDKIGITGLIEQISYNKSFISSEHKGEIELNIKLHTFLGREEIKFEVADEGGYIIKRGDKIAKNLSEGEKSAIAFVYFIVHLQDENFNIQDGIIVIDDPISSLDSNSIFQAFSFLKNSVKEARQVFIMTHNFDFFKLVYGWISYRQMGKCFMIKNKYTNEKERIAEISKIDPFLEKYNTEYEYLFSQLYKFSQNNSEDKKIEDVYHIPNIGRKVLETFLMFRIPNNKSLSAKVAQLEDEDVFDKNQLTAINKFFNDQSHITGSGFDPSLVQESEKNVKYLLNMIENIFPEHYQILIEELSSQ